MPISPKRTCNHPGCPNTSHKSYCEQHHIELEQRRLDNSRSYEQGRGTSTERGYNWQWRKERAVYLKANPLCVHCKAKGIVKPATELDHIIPHRGDKQLFDDKDNRQGLCKPCHSKKTRAGY